MSFTSEIASYRRGSIMGQSMGELSLSPDTFEAMENYIRVCQISKRKFPGAMDSLVHLMSLVHLGYAQKYAAGPRDPRQVQPELAWKLPVRRISGRYFFGWKVRKVNLGHYEMYNDSREAFFIEYGIHRNPATGQVSPGRIRRPINKLSLLRTLRFLQTTPVADRVWSSVFYPPPGMRSGKGFLWTMQSPFVQYQTFPDFHGMGASVDLRNTPIG